MDKQRLPSAMTDNGCAAFAEMISAMHGLIQNINSNASSAHPRPSILRNPVGSVMGPENGCASHLSLIHDDYQSCSDRASMIQTLQDQESTSSHNNQEFPAANVQTLRDPNRREMMASISNMPNIHATSDEFDSSVGHAGLAPQGLECVLNLLQASPAASATSQQHQQHGPVIPSTPPMGAANTLSANDILMLAQGLWQHSQRGVPASASASALTSLSALFTGNLSALNAPPMETQRLWGKLQQQQQQYQQHPGTIQAVTNLNSSLAGGQPDPTNTEIGGSDSTARESENDNLLRALQESLLGSWVNRGPLDAAAGRNTKENERLAEDKGTIQSSESSGVAGTIVLPCRARGLPVDHDFQSAHFMIPVSVRHGEDLVCSYEACRVSGVKFRYCASCRLPVAKRNFHQRHSHGLPVYSSAVNKVTQREVPKAKNRDTSKFGNAMDLDRPSDSSTKNSHVYEVSRAPSHVITTESPCIRRQQKRQSYHASTDMDEDHRRFGNMGKTVQPAIHVDDPIPMDRKWKWASLLGKRPETVDSDSMSAWLLEVMAVSDLAIPLEDKMTGTSTLSQSSDDFE